MKTLYVSDLDGTLLRSTESTSDYTNRTINTLVEKGMLFSYATARSYSTSAKVTKGLSARIPLIVYNGALVIESVTVNGEVAESDALEIVFHNRYTEPEPPKTGDEFKMVLHMSVMLLSVTALVVLIIGKKKQWLA